MKIKQTLLITVSTICLFGLFCSQQVFADCGSVTTNIINCTGSDPIMELVNDIAIPILTALVAIAAVIGIIYGAVLYTSSGGNAENTKKARGIITNTVIGIVAYALMYVILGFLIPGGPF